MRVWVAGTGFLVLCCLMVAAVSAAISVGSITITPSGDFVGGDTKVSVSFVIDLPGEGGVTFPAEGSIQMSTELADPQWAPILIQNGIENPRPISAGQTVNLNGWELSYPSSKNEISLRVSLEGTAPKVSPSKNITVIKVAELNGRNTEEKDSVVTRERFVTNPDEIKSAITAKRTDLASLRTMIDEAAAEGVDVTAAEGNYATAKVELENADRSTSLQVAQSHMNAATAAISEGQASLGDHLTEKVITSAKQPIDLIDEQLTYFTVNRSLGSDPRVVALKTRRDSVVAMITEADDLRSQGRFQEAQDKAKEARASGDTIYEDSLKLRKDLGEVVLPGVDIFGGMGGALGGAGSFLASLLPYFVVVVVVVIIAAVALYLYRRRRGWDELG